MRTSTRIHSPHEWQREPRCPRFRWPTGSVDWRRRMTPSHSTSRLAPTLASRFCACCRLATSWRGGASSTSAVAPDGRCATSSTRPHSAEIWGCDIDHESVDWLQHNLCPPLHVLRNAAAPDRLPFEDGHFDVVWALSVFTHLADTWAAWLLELHRVLADDGILIATTIGPQHSEVDRRRALGGGPHRHERASPLGLMGGRRANGPSLDLVAAGSLGRAFEIIVRRSTTRRLGVGALQPSLARNEKA